MSLQIPEDVVMNWVAGISLAILLCTTSYLYGYHTGMKLPRQPSFSERTICYNAVLYPKRYCADVAAAAKIKTPK